MADKLSTEAVERARVVLLLRTGLGAALVLMLLGIIVKIAEGDHGAPAIAMMTLFDAGVPIADRLLGLGVLCLGLTPVLRVVTLLVSWWREKDWPFVAVAGAVLVTLIIAIALGGH